MANYQMINGGALAFMGDAVYEVAVRQHVLATQQTSPQELHRMAIRYVSATAQSSVMRHWISSDEYLTPEEIQYYKRGRNFKANTKAKNASIGEYRQATGFESLIGGLYLNGQAERADELIQQAIAWIDQKMATSGPSA